MVALSPSGLVKMLNLSCSSGVPDNLGDPLRRDVHAGFHLDGEVPPNLKITVSSNGGVIPLDSAPPPNPNSEPDVPGSLSSP